ncbi:MAG: hypothetical protein GX275_06065 [Clostridiales bacterium]|nr:hypothetical protein [Clostridiales bacterium]
MADIEQSINLIKTAVYGEEVRESIINGIEAINKEAENTTFRQKNVETKQNELNTSQEALKNRWDVQIKNITDANPSNVEIVDGRVSSIKGLTFTNLGLRLNNIEEDMLSRGINVLYPPAGLTPMQRVTDITAISETDLQAIAAINTSALNALISYVKTSSLFARTLTKLNFPQGIFPLLNGITINASIYMEGVPCKSDGIGNLTNYMGGTVLYDVSPVESRTDFITFLNKDTGTDNYQGRLPGHHLRNLCFHGRYQKHNGVSLIKTGMVAKYENLLFREWLGSGLIADDAFDTNVFGMDIFRCGSASSIEQLNEDGTIKTDTEGNTLYELRYGLTLTGSYDGWATNAWNIYGLHMESMPFMMKLDKCRHIKFIGGKWEQGKSDPLNNTYPSILITNKAVEISFTSDVFSPIGFEDYRAKYGQYFMPYHFIEIEASVLQLNTRFSQVTKFVCCDFTVAQEALFLRSNASVIIDACKFDHIVSTDKADGTKTFGLSLNGPNNILSNSSVSFRLYNGINNGVYLNGGNADANTFLTSISPYDAKNGIAEVRDYAIFATNAARVGTSNYYDVTYPVKVSDTNCVVPRSGRSGKITNNKLVKMGVTDLTKVSLDLNLLGELSDTLVFSLTESATLTAITNTCNGDVITLLNANDTNLILNNGTSTNAFRLRPTYDKNGKLKTSITLKAYDSITIKNMGSYFEEIGRNIQSENSSARDDDIKEELILSLNCLQSDALTTSQVNIFKEDTSKKNLKLKSCYSSSSSNYQFTAPYTGYFKVSIHSYCNPSVSSPSYFHSISYLHHFKNDVNGSAILVAKIGMTRISTYGGMAGYAIATRTIYMEKGEYFQLFAEGHAENTYSATYQFTQINVTGIKEIS